jgi:hypothetical protein
MPKQTGQPLLVDPPTNSLRRRTELPFQLGIVKIQTYNAVNMSTIQSVPAQVQSIHSLISDANSPLLTDYYFKIVVQTTAPLRSFIRE